MTGEANQALLMRQARVKKVPTGWKLSTVGEVCSIRNDLRKPISLEEREKIKGQYPYYGPTGVLNYINEYRLDGKFALIGEDGDHFLKYKSWSQTQLIEGKANVNNHAHVIESTPICSVEWFHIFFEHRDLTEFLTRQGAGRFKLNKATLQQLPILIPPIHEQRRVAELLAIWDEAITLTERVFKAKKKEQREFVKNFFGSSDDSNSPQNTNLVKLREVVSKIGSGITPRGGSQVYVSEGIPLIRSQNVQSAYLDLSDVVFIDDAQHLKMRNSKVCPKDVLLNITGASIGRSCVVPIELEDANVNQHVCILRPRKEANPHYLSAFLNSYLGQQQIFSFQVGGSREGLNYQQIGSFQLKLPPRNEQDKLADFLGLLNLEIQLLQLLQDKYQEQKRGLMQKLLTGEWRIAVQEAA